MMEELTGQRGGQLDQSDVRHFLEQAGVVFKTKHLGVLMAHLGVGAVMTAESAEEVMELQTAQ